VAPKTFSYADFRAAANRQSSHAEQTHTGYEYGQYRCNLHDHMGALLRLVLRNRFIQNLYSNPGWVMASMTSSAHLYYEKDYRLSA
jgi:hypothetical protein